MAQLCQKRLGLRADAAGVGHSAASTSVQSCGGGASGGARSTSPPNRASHAATAAAQFGSRAIAASTCSELC